jgi:hypothetical protein
MDWSELAQGPEYSSREHGTETSCSLQFQFSTGFQVEITNFPLSKQVTFGGRPVGQIAAGLLQHSHSCLQSPRDP